jgi:hypothetical protein
MAKSQLNNMSKKEILQSLMYEQNQSNATLSRLITAVARTANVDAEKLAEMFTQDKENQDYVEKFNVAVKEIHSKRVEQENADQATIAGKTTEALGDETSQLDETITE